MTDTLVNYFVGDLMAADVWQDKYQVKDSHNNRMEETPSDMHLRMAKEFARVEHKYHTTVEFDNIQTVTTIGDGFKIDFEKVSLLSKFGQDLLNKRTRQSLKDIEDEFFSYFDKFSDIIPQGSIMANLGNKYVYGSLSNCFGIGSPHDSYAGIMRTDEEIAQLEKRRGGVGAVLDNIRPAGAKVSNAARTSTGVVSFAERFSNTTREVAQEGRRGALMLLLSCKHPEIFKYVTMKDDRTKVTGANVSAMLTDEFMYAVENDSDFYCRFPISYKVDGYDIVPMEDESYNKLISLANGVSIMKIHAKELFNLIAEMAHKNGEPGIAFIDRIKDYCPDGVYPQYEPEVCNPCGEQWFHAYETCRLIAVNFFNFVTSPFTVEAKVDYEKIYEVCYMQQRLGDNLVDLEVEHIDRLIAKIKSDPEPEDIKRVELELWQKIRKIAVEGRRTGSGFTALGDMLAALGFSYGSERALYVTEQVTKTKMKAELDCMIDMAILRGPFVGCNAKMEFELEALSTSEYKYGAKIGKNGFYQMLVDEFPEQANRMAQYGRRNVSWSTVAPTGTVSIMTRTTSGLEPLFKCYHIRRKKINPSEEGARVDFIDQNGDKWQEYAVLHPKFRDWIVKGLPFPESNGMKWNSIMYYSINDLPKDAIQSRFESSPWFGSEADDIPYLQRVNLQSVIQKYTSNAISSTINLPTDVEQEVVGEIYLRAWKAGLKGVTVYREGSRTGVLISDTIKFTKCDEFGYRDSTKRPQELDADYYYVKSNGHAYAVIVGLMNEFPYEIFAFENPLVDHRLKGKVIKNGKNMYSFRSDAPSYTIDNLQLTSDRTDEKLLTRWVSLLLRHGANPKYISEQVDKSEVNVTSFGKVISRVLKHYVPDHNVDGEVCPACGEATVVYQEGCKHCTSCGHSKC